MGGRIVKFIIIGLVCYGIYFVMGHHIIYFGGKDVAFLKKPKLDFTLSNVFKSYPNAKEVHYIGLENILKEKDLRDAGIGQELVKRELVTEEALQAAEEKVDSEE